MAPPPNARAKRGNASKYCCGSGHAHRQGGSPAKAKVSAAMHCSASAAVAVRMNESDMIQYVLFVSFLVFPRASDERAAREWQLTDGKHVRQRKPFAEPTHSWALRLASSEVIARSMRN